MDKKKTFKITGMSCASCAARLEKGLNKQEGVKKASVNFALEQATVEYDDQRVRENNLTKPSKTRFEVIPEQPAGKWFLILKG